ncbi:ABC transporter substrate-binding protein [Natronosalvus halobius]|uniref:ABC transporter substrate-binding protein n=1 Tax=Natronosalvus halobius TaxID=2953746 RepID=UPI0020A12DFD|nr:ABC transporter substrate-binding protein [Natronosalvus halobius]USZ70301.1 ABC transporter substrate-binding protein [Natronosalvus halobius]
MPHKDLKAPGAHRREVLLLAGAAGAAGLAGCMSGDDNGNGNGNNTGNGNGDDDDDDVSDDISDQADVSDREIQPDWIAPSASEAQDLNPLRINDTTSSARLAPLLDGPYGLDENDEFYGYWFEDYETEDNKTWTFHLRDNLEWGDDYGQMTTEDWVFHIENVAQNEDNWAAHVNQSNWDDVESVTAVDDTTLEIEIAAADPLFVRQPTFWGTYILPKGLVEPYFQDYQDGNEEAGEELNSSDAVQQLTYTGNLGPYTFEERAVEDRFVAVRNEDYYKRGDDEDWEDAPYFDQYTINILEEESTRLAEFETGGLSTVGIPADQVENYQGQDDYTLVESATPYCSILAFNQRANGWEELRKREVRRALSMAIDKETVANDIYRGYAIPAQTFQPEYSDFYDDSEVDPVGVGDTYDVDEARSLLEENLSDGYSYDGDALLDPDGDQVVLSFVYTNGSPLTEDSARYIADALGGLGIDVDSNGVPFNTMLEQYAMVAEDGEPQGIFNDPEAEDPQALSSAREWDMMWGIGFNTYPRSPGSIAAFWTASSGTNFYGYVPEEDLGSMIQEGATATDEAEQQEIFAEVFGILSRDLPVNFMHFQDDIYGYQNEVVFTEDPSPSWGYKSNSWWMTDDPHN